MSVSVLLSPALLGVVRRHFEAIAGIIQPDSGELKVTLNDGSINDLTSFDLKIGFVAQSPTVVSDLFLMGIVLGSVTLLTKMLQVKI